MKDIHISLSFKPLARLFKRYHLTFFIVFVAAGLAFAVLTFTQLLGASSTDTTYTSPIGAGSIDQATLERIKALHTSEEAVPDPTTTGGRTNPFSE